MKKGTLILFVFLVFPGLAFAKGQPESTDPHLQLFWEGRRALWSVARDTKDDQALEYHERLIAESLKMKPSADRLAKISAIPGCKPFGDEVFVVVPVLESDCKLSPFWENVCQEVSGAATFHDSPEFPPMLVIRQGMSEEQLGIAIAGAMVFLEETSDSPCPNDATQDEADRLENVAKEKAAYELRLRLSTKLPQKQ